ncbi:MAG: hypothetical protein HYZ81_10820 [Nitrospinae bacterium]|nr:hypothetical protein [Nitrospinota bacterium]
MGHLAEAMTNVVQHIQSATALRSAHLDELRAVTKGLLREFRITQRGMARGLQGMLEAVAKARAVRVSELRSDSQNLLQRLKLEHQDMGRALRGNLAAQGNARLGADRMEAEERQATMHTLHATLRVDAQHLREGLHRANDGRTHAMRHALQEIGADVRQARDLWREGLKKKLPSVAEVTIRAGGAIAEVAAVPGSAEKTARGAPAEEEAGGRAYPEGDRVVTVIQAHPDGIRLVEIGNELGVDWRSLIAAVKFLMDEGKVEKIDNVYYPAQR